MTVLDLSAGEAPASALTAPICIIGAGMAGLVLARRLARGGRRVIVLESGGIAFDGAVHDLNALEDRHGRYTRAMTGHYRGLGGSSTKWGGRMVPIALAETRERPEAGLPGWAFPAEELQRYYPEVEALFGLDAGPFGEEALTDLDPDGLVPRNDPDFIAKLAKWPRFRNCNLAEVLGKELRAEARAQIWLNATVCAFDVDAGSGRLIGITARNHLGRHVTVRAEHFVIAAGTIESTRLLLWLNASTDGRAFGRTPALGRYLQDHINVGIARVSRRDPEVSNRFCAYHLQKGGRRSLHLELTPTAQRADRIAGAFAYLTMDLAGSPLDAVKRAARSLQSRELAIGPIIEMARHLPLMTRALWWSLVRRQLFLPAEVPIWLEICAEQRPDARNGIGLSQQRDALGLPKARIEWRPGEADERTLRAAADRLAAYWARNGLEGRMPLDWIEAYRNPEGRISDVAVDYAHPSGTARMGTGRHDSVVDAQLVCHDVPNLSVLGAAVFPAAGSANPTFTILALAMRHADSLLDPRPRPPPHSSFEPEDVGGSSRNIHG